MLLVIFGAGATFDSYAVQNENDKQLRPPLAAQLADPRFNFITDRLPAAMPVVDYLREKTQSEQAPIQLETALAEFAMEGHSFHRQQLMAFRFYLRQVIEASVHEWQELNHGYTHYLRLLGHLLRWQIASGQRVLLMTFNYDTLLEQAAEVIVPGWGFASPILDTYVNRPDFRMFKVHGSTSWTRVVPWAQNMVGDQLPPAMQYAANGGEFSSGDVFGNPPPQNVGQGEQAGRIMLPALAVPMANKTDFECPKGHLDMLRADLPDVKHVLIVGWRAAETHAVDLLSGGDDPQQGLFPSFDLGIVAGSAEDRAQTYNNLGPVAEKGVVRVHDAEGFTHFMGDISTNLNLLLDHPNSPHRLSARGQ